VADGFDIVVVGGGASGALVTANLLRACRAPARFALIGSDTPLGRGVAYGTNRDDHLLNVPAQGMSALVEQPDHFLRWAQRKIPDVSGTDYLPRRLYGDYVGELLAQSIQIGRTYGAELALMSDRVIAAHPAPGGAAIDLAGGTCLRARKVVLALGNFAPAVVPGIPDELKQDGGRYVNDPWAQGALDGIRGTDTLLLVGTGLTMYDVFLGLQLVQPGPRAVAISRNGLRPEVHDLSTSPPTETEFHRTSSLNDIARAVSDASSESADWRRKIDSVRPLTPGLWQALPLDERREFLRLWRREWDVKRHRAAPAVHERLDGYQEADRLSFEEAELVDVRPANGRLEVLLKEPDGAKTIDVDRIVNCTGPQSDYRTLLDPLVADLRDQEILSPCPLGLGIETDGTCALTDPTGKPSEIFFAVGPPTRPMLWEITAMPEIRQQTAALAYRLLEQVHPAQAPVLV
jgi:uncharacterized NAD(P)/FAD-binding protein YdhS